MPGSPLQFEAVPRLDPARAPLLGEHTDEILAAVLGYSGDHVEHLKEAGAFTKEPPRPADYHPLRA